MASARIKRCNEDGFNSSSDTIIEGKPRALGNEHDFLKLELYCRKEQPCALKGRKDRDLKVKLINVVELLYVKIRNPSGLLLPF